MGSTRKRKDYTGISSLPLVKRTGLTDVPADVFAAISYSDALDNENLAFPKIEQQRLKQEEHGRWPVSRIKWPRTTSGKLFSGLHRPSGEYSARPYPRDSVA